MREHMVGRASGYAKWLVAGSCLYLHFAVIGRFVEGAKCSGFQQTRSRNVLQLIKSSAEAPDAMTGHYGRQRPLGRAGRRSAGSRDQALITR